MLVNNWSWISRCSRFSTTSTQSFSFICKTKTKKQKSTNPNQTSLFGKIISEMAFFFLNRIFAMPFRYVNLHFSIYKPIGHRRKTILSIHIVFYNINLLIKGVHYVCSKQVLTNLWSVKCWYVFDVPKTVLAFFSVSFSFSFFFFSLFLHLIMK